LTSSTSATPLALQVSSSSAFIGARRVGDVDLVFADAFAELLDAGARTAGLDDRGLEVREGLAERLGDDLGIGQHGGRTGDLDLVARRGRHRGRRPAR
jgi:hypothetical protein